MALALSMNSTINLDALKQITIAQRFKVSNLSNCGLTAIFVECYFEWVVCALQDAIDRYAKFRN